MGTMTASTVTSLIDLAVKYGPTAVQAFINLFKKGDPTIADVEAAFNGLKTYDSFGIPGVAPTAPTTPTPASLA